ncbi:MAG: hypothetical protein F6K00_03710 [Leptolyngbya sp. SIOISBB]|nr:hypothetical protein [Leptolyngbya sp. SIOISBB]
MPEEPKSSDIPTPPEETAELTEAEWTEDSGDQTSAGSTADDPPTSATDEWDEATQEQDDTAEFPEAEWTEDSGDQTLEGPIASDISASLATDEWDEAIQEQDDAPEVAEVEWTDDSSYQTLEGSTASDTTPAFAKDEWDEATQEWDDELAELPEPEPQPTTTQEALSWIQPAWQKFRRVWQRLIAGVRNRIPAAAKLSDSALSGILIGILVLLLILLNSVRQPSVASSSPPTEPPNTDLPTASPAESVPNLAPTIDETTEPVLQPLPQSPPDVPVLEPEDSDRIAQIQAQMTDSAILNAQRVIDSVQADFTQNHLTLVFNGDWYRLSDYDQTQLAQALMQQSQGLAFTDLEFVTPAGELLARSPVIGNDMVILQREQPPEVPEPERPRYRLMIDR